MLVAVGEEIRKAADHHERHHHPDRGEAAAVLLQETGAMVTVLDTADENRLRKKIEGSGVTVRTVYARGYALDYAESPAKV